MQTIVTHSEPTMVDSLHALSDYELVEIAKALPRILYLRGGISIDTLREIAWCNSLALGKVTGTNSDC